VTEIRTQALRPCRSLPAGWRSVGRTAGLALCLAVSLAAQRGPITGRAVDADGAPIPRLSVRLIGGGSGAVEADGRFLVDAPDRATARLELRARGRATTVVTVSGRAEVGTIAIPRGLPIAGRVQDTRGDPLGGVTVRAVDALADLPFFPTLEDPVVVFEAWGLTAADGTFRIDGGLAGAVRVVAAVEPGVETAIELVEPGVPVELVLPVVRSVAVRVVEPGGAAVEGALVVVDEAGRQRVAGRTDADGSLRLRVPEGPGQQVRAQLLRGSIRVRSAPRMLPEQGEVEERTLVLGAPDLGALVLETPGLGGFEAVLLFGDRWPARAEDPALARGFLDRPLRGRDGLLRIPSVPPGTPFVAELRAPGRGRAYVRGVAGRRDRHRVELAPETVVSGVVLDAATGDPVAGVGLSLRRALQELGVVDAALRAGPDGPAIESMPAEVVSAADGTFELGGIGAGRWVIEARVGPLHRPAEVEVLVRARDRIEGLPIRVDRGGTLAGRVLGAAPGFAVRARTPGGIAARAELGADGRFALERVPRGRVDVELEVPQPIRLGAPRGWTAGELRLGDADLDASFDAGAVVRRVAGRLSFEGAAPPAGRAVVFLEPLVPRHAAADLQNLWLEGAAAEVGADGEFALWTGLGEHVALVVDVATGAVLDRIDGIKVEAGADPLRLPPIRTRVQQVRVRLEGGSGAMRHAHRLEIALGPWFPEGVGRMASGSPITRAWDRGPGVSVGLGQRSVELFLPFAEIELRLRGDHFDRLGDNVLGRALVEPREAEVVEVQLSVAGER
jgi:hypothetical protein